MAIFYTDFPRPTEILLPLGRYFIDYNELILDAIQKISKTENRDIEQVINDLLLPPSDVVRFRVAHKKTECGLITFTEGFKLLENAKKSLFITACDILQPTFFHKKMSNKGAQQFIDSCYLGQTERGSFIASVVCPFINENTADDKPIQLSLFDLEEDLMKSFTRRVTEKYMRSLAKLKIVIESGHYETIECLTPSEIISANLIESIIELGEYGDEEEIEISTSWSSIIKESINVPKTIIFTKDYISPMDAIVSKLKPKDEGKEGSFVGKVSKAQAEPDPSQRSEGEITFNFIGEGDSPVKAVLEHRRF